MSSDPEIDRQVRWLMSEMFPLRIPPVQVRPAPTRAETIKHIWEKAQYDFSVLTGKLTVAHDLDIIEPVTFELIRYGGMWAIEAEGVVVQTMPAVDA